MKTYVPAAVIAVVVMAALILSATGHGLYLQNRSANCLPGYFEIDFGKGAFACQRGSNPMPN
jgi:hypothetical protein